MLDTEIMNQVIIRRPKVDEMEQLFDFFQTVLEDTYHNNGISDLKELFAEENQSKHKYVQQDFNTNGVDRFFLIAEYNHEIIGSIEYGLADELIKKCTYNELEGIFELGTVFVHPNHQRKGVSSLLLYSILQELKKKEVEEVCLDSGYKTAQKVWSHRFGKPTYHLKDFWGPGSDHMIWKTSLEDTLELCRKALGVDPYIVF